MNFDKFKWVEDLMWVDGPLLALFKVGETLFLAKWTDVNAHFHNWIFVEVTAGQLDLYMQGGITMHSIERQSPRIFTNDSDISHGNGHLLRPLVYDDIPELWTSPAGVSLYDPSLAPSYK